MTGKALLHWFKFFIGFDKPHSQTTELEQQAISKYASNADVCVEIGVYEGANTVNIAKSMSHDGKLFAIDPFFKGILGISYGKMITIRNAKKNNVSDKIIFIEKFSHGATNDVPNNIDFIFIDGDHSLPGIERDWFDWSQKVKIGGIIALHDTSEPTHDPSVKHLGSFIYFNSNIIKDNRFEIIETVDSLNILKKIV